jgi:hypothetical protein
MPLDQATSELVATLTARIDAVVRLCATSKAPLPRLRKEHAGTVIGEARSAVEAGKAAELQSALRSIDLLSFELCNE